MIPRRLAAVLAAAACLLAARCAAFGGPRPNVLLLVMDTTRADRCSFVDGGRPTTPALEQLAADSVVFEDAWSPSCWTFPAHAALFTGRHPAELRVADGVTRIISRDVPTIAERFRDDGYATACFTNNAWIAPHTGLARGFDDIEALYISASGPSAAAAHRRALAWMRERKQREERFFAFVNDVEPHSPWDPPEEFARRFVRSGAIDSPVMTQAQRLQMSGKTSTGATNLLAKEVVETVSDLYDAEVAELDSEIGRLLDGMRAEGLLDDTIIVVVGDHGEGLGDHGWLEHGAFLYRELLRVPLLIRPPGGTGGRRVPGVVRLEDVPTTLLEACRVDLEEHEEGRDLLGPSPNRPSFGVERARREWQQQITTWLDAETAELFSRARRSLYDGRYHLIVDDRGGAELFDVSADPGEKKNLADSAPEVVERMRRAIDAAAPAPR